jgi:integrase
MAGMRALKENEFHLLLGVIEETFSPQVALRYKSMFTLQAATGLRANEICTLLVGDVARDLKTPNEYVTPQKRHMKMKKEGRVIISNPLAQRAIQAWLQFREPESVSDCFFSTLKEGINYIIDREFTNKPVHICTYCASFRKAAKLAQLPPPVNTHSLRKMFAMKIWENTGHNLMAVRLALGHSSAETTLAYLEAEDEYVRDLVKNLYQ